MDTSLDRRSLLLVCASLPALRPSLAWAAVAPRYPATVKALRQGATTEMNAHFRYVRFSRKAQEEGYKGIAYMLTALASSELIHAQNYERVLVSLGEPIERHLPPDLTVSDTKANLIYSANAEINTVDNVYPAILKSLQGERHAIAIRNVNYAWESHKQHRDIIKKIRKYSPDFFETVARRIDKKSDHYYICDICGSTLYEIPKPVCPICRNPSTHYSLLSQEAFQ
jgi:rubrerythrin